jgi:hypothetical protein
MDGNLESTVDLSAHRGGRSLDELELIDPLLHLAVVVGPDSHSHDQDSQAAAASRAYVSRSCLDSWSAPWDGFACRSAAQLSGASAG